MGNIRVNLKDRSYSIVIESDALKKIGGFLKKLCIGKDALVVTNKGLLRLYGMKLERFLSAAGFSVKFEMVPDSERAKSSAVAINLISRIARYDKKRELFIIAFGGGVIGDLAGFVAAIYKRGIPYIQVPTTLLAQVDSSIGGKTAVDLDIAKNLIGAFYQPKIVLSDISLLETLSPRQIASGLSEIIKYGIIKDGRFFEFLERNYTKILLRDLTVMKYVIERSSIIKGRVVESDEFDRLGIRTILNYGHTIGHAVEAAACYSAKYNHGESVAIGMAVAADIAVRLGMISKTEADRIKRLILKCGLPVRITGLSAGRIFDSLLHDKKFERGAIRLVLPVSIGSVKVVDGIGEGAIKKAIKDNIN